MAKSTKLSHYSDERLRTMAQHFNVFLWELWDFLSKKGEDGQWRSGPHRTVPLDEYALDMADFVANGPPLKIVLAKRGFGKTLLITSAFAAFRFYQDPHRRVLIMSKNADFAKRLIRALRYWIQTVPFLQHLKPAEDSLDRKDQFQIGIAEVRTQPSMMSLGVDGMVTGNRANTIIADDVETPENTGTLTARDDLESKCNEFISVLEDDMPGQAPSEIVYIGTYHHHDSLYTRQSKKGFTVRSYPLVYPQTGEKVVGLAPVFANRLLAGMAKPGDLCMPERFGKGYAERRRRTGKLHYMMQECLVANTSATQKYPLSLSDFIVVDHVDRDKAPVHIGWGKKDSAGHDTVREDIPTIGLFEDDRFYGPVTYSASNEWMPYQRTIAYIDPAGRGKDETGVTVLGTLAGRLWIKCCTGLPGGWDEATLEVLAQLLREHGAQEIYLEDNMSRGMWQSQFEPIMRRYFLEPDPARAAFPQGWKASITDDEAKGQKEVRIINALDGPLSSHKIVIGADSLMPTDDLEREYELQYQLSAITLERDSLTHYDRLDSLAGAVRRCEDVLRMDTHKAEERARGRFIDQQLKDAQRRMGMRVRQPRFFQHRR